MCSTVQTRIASSGPRRVWPKGVRAYSTRGGASACTVRCASPSRSSWRRVCVSIFSLTPSNRRRSALADLGDASSAEEVAPALGGAYAELARTRGVHLSLMQAFLLGADPVIGRAARDGFLQVWGFLRDEAGLEAEVAHRFLADGMLINTLLGLRMDLPDVDAPSAREILEQAWSARSDGQGDERSR